MLSSTIENSFFINLFSSFDFNVVVSILCLSTFMFNVMILRLRKYYLPFNKRLFITMSFIPAVNFCFLFLNMLVFFTNISGYSIKRMRRTKNTYKYHKNKPQSKAKVTKIS